MNAFAVCSDRKIDKVNANEDFTSFLRPSDLIIPATTDATMLAQEVNAALAAKSDDTMTVVFATYQSLDVIHQAQKLDPPMFSQLRNSIISLKWLKHHVCAILTIPLAH